MTRAQRPDDDGTYVDVTAFEERAAQEDAAELAGPDPEDAAHDEQPADSEAPGATADDARPDANVRPATGVRSKRPGRGRTWLLAGAALAAGVAIGVGVSSLGQPATAQMPSNHPPVSAMPSSGAAAPATPAPLDEAKVAEWKKAVEANASDTEALRNLATEYARVEQYAESATWQQKVVDLKPADLDNRLILGVTYYNDGQYGPAEENWLKAAELAPSDPGPWYNLGFLYLSLEPPQADKAEAAWRKVIEVAPDSSLASSVQNHLAALNTTPTAAPTASPDASAPTPSPTPAK